MCVEWLRANGHAVPTAGEQRRSPARRGGHADAPARAVPTDLFGNPLPEQEPTSAPAATPATVAEELTPTSTESTELLPLRGLTTEDIESFKALGLEVCFRSEAFGELWLVPEYTGQDRQELSPEHAATVCHVLRAFPGSRVIAFEKNAKPSKEATA